MDMDAKIFALIFLFFVGLIWLFWDWITDVKGVREAWKDLLGDLFESDEYWEDIDWNDDDDEDDDKTVNGDH